MKRVLLALSLVGLLVLPAFGEMIKIDLPWKKFSEAAGDAAGAGLGACPVGGGEKEVFAVRLVRDHDAYQYWFEAEGGRMVWVVWVGNVAGALPDAVGFGIVDSNSTDLIPPIRWEKFDPSVHKTPCDFLFLQDA